MYLEGLSIGVELNIINSYNGNVLNRVREAFKKGDLETARREQVMNNVLALHIFLSKIYLFTSLFII